MNTAAIYLHGVPGVDTPEAIKTVQYTDIANLKAHLKTLQAGYCDDGEKPKVEQHKNPKNGKTVLNCFSDSDWHYVAMCGFKIKDSVGKPVEIV